MENKCMFLCCMHEKVAEQQLCRSVSASLLFAFHHLLLRSVDSVASGSFFCFFFPPTVGLKVDGESTRESGLILEW